MIGVMALITLVVGVPEVASSLPRLLGVSDAVSQLQPPSPEPAPVVADESDADLAIRATLPRTLVRDVAMPVRLAVTGTPADTLLTVTLEADVVADAVGWLLLEPQRLVVTAGALSGTDLRLLGFGGLPCSETTGTLRISVQEIAEPRRAGERDVELPGISCDVQEPPEAPRTVHLMTPVCGDNWHEDAAALLDDRRPENA